MSADDKKVLQLLLDDFQTIVRNESKYRQEFNIGDRFRTIPNQLHEIQLYLEEKLHIHEAAEKTAPRVLENVDAQLVYVYLFNAQGKQLSRWTHMITPRLLAEYSVNRPIYEASKQIDALVGTKRNAEEHAYLTVAVDSEDVLAQDHPVLDALGQPLLRLKETALKFDRIKAFTHQGHAHHVLNGKLMPIA
jgi:hypothetical protein